MPVLLPIRSPPVWSRNSSKYGCPELPHSVSQPSFMLISSARATLSAFPGSNRYSSNHISITFVMLAVPVFIGVIAVILVLVIL
ncbi:MAG TPA: hypothetical protein GXX37_13900 [Clostridiaceae bacterium]|nr:hypothetical protein [Clostridiaceae bacterium]